MQHGHVLFCSGCGENYWSATRELRPGEPCRQCGGPLELGRRSTSLDAPLPDDRRVRATIQAAR